MDIYIERVMYWELNFKICIGHDEKRAVEKWMISILHFSTASVIIN